MAKQPVKQKVATLDELPAFETATLDELPSFGEPVKKKGQPQLAKPTTSVSKSVSAPTKPSLVSPSKEAEEEVGVLDDLWNTFKGAGAKALASIAAVPQFAQNAAIDIMTSATGRSSDFNKLPSAVKKQIRDSISGTLSQGATGVGQLAASSQEATDYLNKKSEDIYKKTRQQEVDVVDELVKFKNNPSAESIQKILYQGLKTTVESIPYMAVGAVSLPALAATSAAAKREEDISKEGNVGIGQLLNAGIYGASEAVFEGVTQKILGKAAKAALGNPAAAKAVAEGFVKSVVKDFTQEGLSEGATTLIQEVSDKITKGEDINFYNLSKQVANSVILGGLSGGGISGAGSGIGAARKYVASKIMPKEQIEKIDNNIKTIQSLNLEQGDDVDPRVNAVVNKKIDDLIAENEAIVAENESIAANLSGDQIKQVFDIDDKLEENFNNAKSIIDDASMDDNAKKLLLEDLLKQQNNLKQEKDAIQKQATSQIPVQPETGVSGEMAQGEPQAEPQGVAQEGQREEIEKRRQEDLMSNAYGYKSLVDDYDAADRYVSVLEGWIDTADRTTEGRKTGLYSETANQGYVKERENFVKGIEKFKEINAKYDAELAALEEQVPTEEVKAEEVEKRRQEGTNQRGTTYKGETTEKDGLIITKYSEFNPEGKRISKGGRIMTPTDFIKEYNITDQDSLDGLEGATEIRIYEVSVGKDTARIDVQGNFPKGNIDFSVIGAGLAELPTKKGKKINEQSVNKVFEANPELKNIGSPQQYSEYLDTVFPDTKVKDIVYHGSKTKKPTEGFLETSIGGNNKVLGAGKGFYFTKDIDYSKNYGETTFSIIDVKNPVDFNSSQYDSVEELEKAVKELPNKGDAVIDFRENKYYPQGEGKLKTSSSPDYIVFKPEQIYTLGSDKDIEGFKNFVKSKEVTPSAGGMIQMAETQPTSKESVEKQMQSVFGLDKTKAKAASIVIDKIVGTMAGRAGTTKEEIYNTISFEKGEPTEQVTVERPVEKVKPTKATPKVEGPIDTEVKFDDAIANQVVSWNKFPEQKKGKGIASRNQVLTKAANDLLNGNITNEEYRAIVEKESPIKPIETFFDPSTGEDIQGALEASKVPLVNSVTGKGEKFIDPKTNQEFEIVSDKVGLRLDIPAYLNNNKWVVTIHADAKDTSTGKTTKDKPVSYTGVAKIKNVTFDYNPNLASKIAKGESARETRFKMRGELVPVEGANVDQQNANAKKEVQSIQNDPSWVQIGTNPFRHSYFYSRSTGKPVLSADEVIQIGGLVYAKNAVEANWNDEKFAVTEKGKPVLGKDGKTVFFQDTKASFSIADDGRMIIKALTDPNVSSPLHEMTHAYEHYLENKERQKILKWAGKKDWSPAVTEKFARGFEKYLSEGKTPSAELNKIFENFKKWLLNIYNGITGSDIDIQLNKDMRKIYDTMLSGEGKQAKAPSVDKVLGKPTPKKVTVNEMTALKDQIKLESKAAKGASKATDQIRKDVAEKVKSFITRGGLSKAQQKSLLNSLAKTNILNPVMRERLFERMQKMFKRADYQDRIKEASAFRNRIKKLAKSDTLQASVAKMAKDFAKVIPEFTDVDVYLENAREVYNAIKKPVRKAASIEAISTFTANELAKQEEKVKNTLLDQYDYLAEAGLIDESMSLAEIQKYILDVESGTKPDAKANEEQIRANISELFDSMAETVNAIAEDGYNPLINEEVELDAYTKKLLKNFTSMDLSRLSVADAYRATEALDNYLTNDIVDNMEAIYKVYEGGVEAKSIEDQNIVAQDFRRLFGGKAMNFLSRAWTAAFSPVKSTLDLVHRSRTVGSKVFDAMGLRTLSNEASRAKTEANSIDKAYVERFDRKKPNGKDFRDVENVFERGIYAHLKRTINGTADQVAAEFARRKDQVVLTIDALLKSEDEKLVKRGKVLESIFSRMQDATNISEVEAVIDPINKDAVNWWTTVYDKYYPEVKKIASSVYNTVLEDDVNYTPDNYEKIIESEETDVDKVKTFKMAFDFLNQQKSGTLMKNNYIKGIPANRVISFDFDYNNSSAFGKMLTDIRTAPSMLQYKGFVQSPSFKKIYPNPQDRQVIQDKLTYYVNEVRSKNVATGSVDAKKFAKVIQAVSRYGTSRALGSFTAGIKQAGTALMNTSIALANDPKSVTKGISLLFNKDAQKFLENSGYGIANRGLESQTAIESANRVIEQTDVNSANKVADAIAKAGKIYLEYSLKNGDVLAARASWYAYYLHDLKKQGIDTTNLDWKNHELNKKAANYAEDQINLQQNVSDASMMGKFLTSKNPYVTITRSMVLPFSSFIFNAKDKITTDVTILTSKNSNNLDKIDAAKSLAATGAEMIMFEALSATISSAIVIGANSILGIEEDEEDREKRRDQYFKSAVTRFATDVLSPIPNLGDKAIVSLINKLLDLAQSDLDEEDKFKLFEYKPQSEIDAMLNIVGGIPEVAAKPLIDMGDTIYKITSDTYIDRFGNEIELSYEDKSKLMYVLAVELIAATNILPAEIVRLNEKVKQQIEKEAR